MVRVLIFTSLIIAAILAAPVALERELLEHPLSRAYAPFRRLEKQIPDSMLQNIQALLLGAWLPFKEMMHQWLMALCA
jgi:hypothetical protein